MPKFTPIGWLNGMGGANLNVCGRCFAAVPTQFTENHIEWHEGLFDGWQDA